VRWHEFLRQSSKNIPSVPKSHPPQSHLQPMRSEPLQRSSRTIYFQWMKLIRQKDKKAADHQ
jgi:hypothetical protein